VRLWSKLRFCSPAHKTQSSRAAALLQPTLPHRMRRCASACRYSTFNHTQATRSRMLELSSASNTMLQHVVLLDQLVDGGFVSVPLDAKTTH
jgi:hypothetical protein